MICCESSHQSSVISHHSNFFIISRVTWRYVHFIALLEPELVLNYLHFFGCLNGQSFELQYPHFRYPTQFSFTCKNLIINLYFLLNLYLNLFFFINTFLLASTFFSRTFTLPLRYFFEISITVHPHKHEYLAGNLYLICSSQVTSSCGSFDKSFFKVSFYCLDCN